jgi:hypothetical protein
VIELLRARGRVAWITAKRREDMFTVLAILFGVLAVGTAWGVFTLMRLLVREAPPAAEAVVLVTFAVVGTIQFLGAVRKSIARFFLGSDLELYLSAPIAHGRLWFLKVVEVAAASEASAFVLLTVTLAYVTTRAPVALPLAVAAVTATMLGAAAAGTTVVMLAARVIPPRRLEAGLVVMAAMIGVGFGLLGPALGGGFGNSQPPDTDAQGALQALAGLRAGLRWFPATWPGTALGAVVDGRWAIALAALGLSLAAGAVLIVTGLVVFRTTFYETWGRLTEVPQRRRRSTLLERLAPPMPAGMRAIVVKDWQMVFRDPKRIVGLFMPLVMLGYFVVSGILRDTGAGGRPFVILMLSFAVAGLAHLTFTLEGRNIALYRSAPVRMRDVFWAKFVAWALFGFLLTSLAVTGLAVVQGWPVGRALGLVVAGTWIVSGVLMVNLALAGLWTDFTIDRDQPSPGGPLVGMLLAAIFVGTQLVFPGWLAARNALGPLAHPAFGLLALTPAALAVLGTLWLADRAVRRLECIEAV